jgi:hypothetical protein
VSYARRTDANHGELKGYFERMGCSVLDLFRVGQGCPDMLVALHGFSVLVEAKVKGGELNPDQTRFHREWKGEICQATTLDDCLRIVAAMKAQMKRFQRL